MLIDPLTLAAFIPAGLALNMTPGADMMFCLAQGLRGAGPRSAVAASAGISLGGMVNVALAGLGLGAIVAASPQVFGVIRWVGAAYLLWLAWRTFRDPITARAGVKALSPKRAFRDGMIVNITNPKVILFILAFIPQFVDPARGPVFAQFLIFGSVLALGGFFINAGVGISGARFGRALANHPAFERSLRWLSSAVFASLALKLIWNTKEP